MVKGPNAFSSSIIRSTFMICQSQIFYSTLNPQASVAQKIADEVVFRHFQGEGVEFFFKSDLTDPPQNFLDHLLKNIDLSSSKFHFSVIFISRSCFESDGCIAYSNE